MLKFRRLLFTGCFVLLGVFGQSLHFLPGFAHDHACSTHVPKSNHHCGHTHHHGPEHKSSPGSAPIATDRHKCAICEFYANLQSSLPAAVIGPAVRVEFAEHFSPLLGVSRVSPAACQRGPPLS
tara:strand:+ start:459 stop:830 length:372 start_codon:yes stop_codon:yes gene_type:complete